MSGRALLTITASLAVSFCLSVAQADDEPAGQNRVGQAKAAAPPTSEPAKITKIEFLSAYSMCDSTITAKAGDVIVLVQTNIPREPQNEAARLDNYVLQYTTAHRDVRSFRRGQSAISTHL